MHRCVRTSRQDSPRSFQDFRRSNRWRSRIGVEYLFNRVYLFVPLDLSRLRERIERSPRFEENIYIYVYSRECHVQPLYSFTVVARGRWLHAGAKLGYREYRCICIIVRTNFELCQKDLVGSSWAVSTPMLHAALPRSQIPNSIRMNYLCEYAPF